MVTTVRRLLCTATFLLGICTAASAQPVASDPDSTSARFGTWSLTCLGGAAGRRCEVTHVETDRQQQPVAVLGMGRLAKGMPFRIVLRVPVNVSVAVPAKLIMEGGPAVLLPFRTCSPLGCFAEFEFGDEAGLMRRLRGLVADKSGRVEWQDSGGAAVGFDLPFKGLVPALDGLAKETR